MPTVFFSGIGSVVESAIAGNIKSFGDFAITFGVGAAIGAIGYSVQAGIQALGNKKTQSIMGVSSKTIKINNRLAAAGFSNLKVGKLGYQAVYNVLY